MKWIGHEQILSSNIIYTCCRCGHQSMSAEEKLLLSQGRCIGCETNRRRTAFVRKYPVVLAPVKK